MPANQPVHAHGKETHHVTLDADGFERVDGHRTTDRSPDGSPADPSLTKSGTLLIILGSVASVVVLGLIAWAFLGAWAALLVLGLGGAFAIVGNPAIWAAAARTKQQSD